MKASPSLLKKNKQTTNSEEATLGVASGVSIGRYSNEEPDTDLDALFDEYPPEYEKEWSYVVWSNTQVEARHTLGQSSGARFSAGLAASVAHDEPSCDTTNDQVACAESELPALLPYFSLGYEWHF